MGLVVPTGPMMVLRMAGVAVVVLAAAAPKMAATVAVAVTMIPTRAQVQDNPVMKEPAAGLDKVVMEAGQVTMADRVGATRAALSAMQVRPAEMEAMVGQVLQAVPVP